MPQSTGHAATQLSVGLLCQHSKGTGAGLPEKELFKLDHSLSSMLLVSTATHPQRQESRLCPLSSTSHFYVRNIQGLATEDIRHPHPCIESDVSHLRLFSI